MTTGNRWIAPDGNNPEPPDNVQVFTGYRHGIIDLRWDDPSLQYENTNFSVIGVNIYRSVGSDRGPYHRINKAPIGGGFYRDSTQYERITQETVTTWVGFGDQANRRSWTLKTKLPIHKNPPNPPYGTPTFGNHPSDVKVYVDGVEVVVDDVFGRSGEVRILNQPNYNVGTDKFDAATIPSDSSTVTVSYWTNRNHVRSGLDAKIFYRVTTVALSDESTSGLLETDLADTQAVSNIEVETLDYIWREAIRRNNWILEQGGERVKVFVRKQSGVICNCKMDERSLEYTKMPSNRCLTCYGTGFIGGYEGPYETILAPDEAERKVSQTRFGRRLEHSYEVFMGPSPIMTQRDFIVKQTNERYSVGSVRRPTNRGNLLQQHFQIGYLDEGDVRYKVPINGTGEFLWPETRDIRDRGPLTGTRYAPTPHGTGAATPMGTDKTGIEDEREQRGRSRVWEYQNY